VSPAVLTARYLTRFRCLASACEDTCCRGWQVPVAADRWRMLRKVMGASPEGRAELEAHVAETPDGGGQLRMRADGSCPFLTGAQLCSIQERHGEAALPGVCASYPRTVARAGERREVWGSLSCPEVARLVLLAEDALELVDAPDDLSVEPNPQTGSDPPARHEPTRVLDPRLPYERHHGEIRTVALELLSLREESLATRLFLLAWLGHETADFFRKDAATIDGARLSAALALVRRPETIALWRRELAAMPPPRAMTANLITQLARARTELEAGALRGLLTDTLAGWGDGITFDDVGQVTVSPAAVWGGYAGRRQFWQDHHGPRIDLYFANYTRNFWLRDWYTGAIDLLAHARRLLVRVAVLRLLLFGHPALAAARALEDAEARQAALDRAAVDVFYKLSRAVEHESTFLDRIAATVVAGGMQTLAHSTFLALV
jgi:lysine-N-methylase